MIAIFVLLMTVTLCIGWVYYKKSTTRLQIGCNPEWTFAALKSECILYPEENLGFKVLADKADKSGTIPCLRLADGEYVCIFKKDILMTEKRRDSCSWL
jgi:hypothetical protein